MNRRTETAYKAWSPGKAAQHVEAQGSGDRVNAAAVWWQFTILDRYEQMVRYYGHYSNKLRGMRKKSETDDKIPTVMPGEMSSEQFR